MTWCDFWLYLLISIVGAFLGVIGAYIIYRFQLEKDNKKDKHRQELQDKDLLKYFHTLLKQVVATVENQKNLFIEYTENQKQNFTQISSMKTVSNNDFIRIKKLDDAVLFNAWMNNINIQEKLKGYLNLQAELDYIEGIIKNMYSIYDDNAKKVLLFFQKQIGIYQNLFLH